MSAPIHSPSRFYDDHTSIRGGDPAHSVSTHYAAAVPTIYICRSEQLESAISESTPKQDADVESKHEGEIEAMPDDSAAKEKEYQ